MMADSLPPDWAIERALSLGFTGTKLDDVKRHWPGHTAHIAFARYIAEHEEPPVDSLLVEARKLASTLLGAKGQDAAAYEILYGKNDTEKTVQAALAGLKRGMELAQRKRP